MRAKKYIGLNKLLLKRDLDSLKKIVDYRANQAKISKKEVV